MKTRTERRVAAQYRWDRLTVSFWFAPALMALGAILLARVMFALDDLVPNEALANSHFVLAGTSGEMRSSLLNVAGTVLATAGVVFALLTLPLSTVAAQYGSRLLRLFLRDRTTQLVLGMFVATFVYCVAAALSIPVDSLSRESPQLTATLGLYLMLATFATLIVLVQHITTMLQAPNIAAAAGAELMHMMSAAGDDKGEFMDRAHSEDLLGILEESAGFPLRVHHTGYIQYMDPDTLLALAQEKNLVIRLLQKPGQFVWADSVVGLIWPGERVDAQTEKLVLRAFQIGNGRSPTQDVAYAVNQLTEMAVRAMSPAINDPFTAMTCLDHLGHGLAEFLRQGDRSPNYYDRDGKLRLLLEPVTFGELLSAAFDMLRHASCDNATVLLHMLEVIAVVGQEAKTLDMRGLLAHHVNLIEAESQAGELIGQDRQQIRLRAEDLRMHLA